MRLFHRLISALLLMAYAVTGTSLMPAVMTMLVDLDGSHQSLVRVSEGGAQVVLHHRQSEFTPDVKDHRRGLARVLVSLCRADQDGDHQMTTSQLSGNASQERVMLSKVRSGDGLFNAQATHEWQHMLQLPKVSVTRVNAPAPQVSISYQPPSLLTTIQLLI
jgi:hypothetical protein